jgi:hypothetical protein
VAPDEATEPLLAALEDPARSVRTMAMVVLVSRNPPSLQGEQIVARLGGEFKAAECFVHQGWGAGPIGSFALTKRLLPHLDQIAQTSCRWKARMRPTRRRLLRGRSKPEAAL